MKPYILVYLLWLIASCTVPTPCTPVVEVNPSPPPILLEKQGANMLFRNDTVYVNNEHYSGFLFQLHPNSRDTFSVEGYYNGLLTGICKKWYPNGNLMELRMYRQGKKHGLQQSFWDNGHKRFEFVAHNDVYEGALMEWNNNGKLIHEAHFVNGQEEGAQKMWYDNGKIRANYVIVKGKRYGLLGTKNCKNVSDSIFLAD